MSIASRPAAAAMSMTLSIAASVIGLLLAGSTATAQAQPKYKVVAPDGRITYTDRPSTNPADKVVPLGRDAAVPEATPLPLALRQLVARFPVTLYASADCAPCESGRQLLQQRGIPYAERLIASEDDIVALNRLTGGRTVPALTVGTQALRGYLESDWLSYLDAAGYPRESQLPRDYQPPSATPLVPRPASAAAEAPLPTVSAEPLPRVLPTTPPSGIRF